jgi:hypothetical protein
MPCASLTSPLRAVLQSDPLALLTGLGIDLGPELGPEIRVDSIVPVSTGVYPVDSGVPGITLTLPQLSTAVDTSTSQKDRNVRCRNSTYIGIAIELVGDLMAYQYQQLRGTHTDTDTDSHTHTDTHTDNGRGSGSGCCDSRHWTESETATASLLSRAIRAITKQLRSAPTALLCFC